jgi:hypothetical protein
VPGETAQHQELKRLALEWAFQHGYAVAAREVSLPHLRFRIDVAAYRPQKERIRLASGRHARVAVLGTTAVFECKQARSDFLQDGRRSSLLAERLRILHARKERHELRLRLHYPSLRNGETLFPEYDSYDFARCGDELYLRDIAQLRTAARQLHEQTKFEKLREWQSANLHYIVAEEGLVRNHELPDGWGLLVRCGELLELRVKPLWHDPPESARLTMLQQIAAARIKLAI